MSPLRAFTTHYRTLDTNAPDHWSIACRDAERMIPALHEHMGTWGSQCGASRETYLGHLVKMLLESVEEVKP